MNNINMDYWVRSVLESNCRKVIPIMTSPGIELCGRTIKEAVQCGKVHAEAICRLNEKYPADAVTAIMDLTVEAEAFGASIIFPEDEIPSVNGSLVSDYKSVEALEVPSLNAGRLSEFLRANQMVVSAVKNKPVFAGCIGPFSLAARLYGLSEIMIAMFTEPKTVHLLLEKCTSFLLNYCQAIKKTGAAGVIMAEPVAGLISNSDCEMFSSVYVRKIAKAVQDDYFLLVLHNCGNDGHCTSAMCHSDARVLHFGNKIDIVKALKEVPSDVLAMGNLDPVALFKQASPEGVFAATRELLERTRTYLNFILSTGCDIPPHVPCENIEAFYRAVKGYNRIDAFV